MNCFNLRSMRYFFCIRIRDRCACDSIEFNARYSGITSIDICYSLSKKGNFYFIHCYDHILYIL